jgi:4-hydroxythreonine-4-phosphate dehydrogenase
MSSRIGICIGDVTGIGPEVTLKALATERAEARFLLLGDLAHLETLAKQLGIDLPLEAGSGEKPGRFAVYNPLPDPLPQKLAPGDRVAAKAAMAWLKAGAELCLRNEIDALVTAPVNKEAIIRAGFSFIGQTELLSGIAGNDATVMMLLGQDDRGRWLRVALATTHLALKLVPDRLTQARVELAIQLAAKSCRDLGLARARVGVCGLNPHAGEGGHMGTEEQTIIQPAVEAARAHGVDVAGPLSADALFYYAYKGDYDAVVAMYHDQGLAPLKMVAFEQGINWTLGLPFIRTSPDHGTAYDIAGCGTANPSSMLAAIRLARQLASSNR